MNVALIGATRGMGREVARVLAARGDRLVLLGRDADALAGVATDLELRGAAKVVCQPFDLADAEAHTPALEAAADALGGKLHAVVVTAGAFGTQEQLEADRGRLAALLDLNFTKTVLLCEAARPLLLREGGGHLVVFSSVAGEAKRKTVALYGATKSGLSHYLESIDLRYRAEGLRVLTVKPGFIRTGMTAGLKEPPFAGEPDAVARDVVDAMDRSLPERYSPGIWRLVMLVIRHLPRFVMRRVGF
jgi:decaprenylphospho-beta-D-erythro-pentofuranosid-2-ulose 2-reductase